MDKVKLFCNSCGFIAETPLHKLPPPSTQTTCPKCKEVKPMYYYIYDNTILCKNPIVENVVRTLEEEFHNCVTTLNNIKPNYSFGCPLCGIGLTASITKDNINNVTIETHYHQKIVCISKQDCPFCKTKMALYLEKNGRLNVIDIEHDNKDHSMRSEIKKVCYELDVAQEELDDAETGKEITTAQRKVATLEQKHQTLELRYDEFLEKYSEKQYKWQDKVFEKYGTAGGHKQ